MSCGHDGCTCGQEQATPITELPQADSGCGGDGCCGGGGHHHAERPGH